MRISPAQIAQLAANAGFDGNDLITAVAIALAESGGDTQAYNPETKAGTPAGFGSYGLWQIYRKAHPEFGPWNLFDPNQNAAAAFSVYNSQGFGAWSAFKSGAYLRYMGTASQAVGGGFTAQPADLPPASSPPDLPASTTIVSPPAAISPGITGISPGVIALGIVGAVGIILVLR